MEEALLMRVINLDTDPAIITLKVDGMLVSWTPDQLREIARRGAVATPAKPLTRRSQVQEKKASNVEKIRSQMQAIQQQIAATGKAPQMDLSVPVSGDRSLASVSIQVAKMVRDSRPLDQGRLVETLSGFDGNIGGRRTSQVGHQLMGLLNTKSGKLTADTKAAISEFLAKYPELLTIHKR